MPPERDEDLLRDIAAAAHHYRKIDSTELWTTVSRDLPDLLHILKARTS